MHKEDLFLSSNNMDKRQEFLELFVKTLILKSIKETRQIEYNSIQTEKLQQPIIQIKEPPKQQIIHQAPDIKIERKTIPLTPVSTSPITQSQATNIPAFSKIEQLIRDVYVQSIECPGKDKFVIVKTYNGMKTTSIKLTEEEINAIMKEFSEKSRIPLIKGVFKAFLGNLLITAVISEFVGTKFIIQKRSILQ